MESSFLERPPTCIHIYAVPATVITSTSMYDVLQYSVQYSEYLYAYAILEAVCHMKSRYCCIHIVVVPGTTFQVPRTPTDKNNRKR